MVHRAKKSFFAGTGGCTRMTKEDFQLKCHLVEERADGVGGAVLFHHHMFRHGLRLWKLLDPCQVFKGVTCFRMHQNYSPEVLLSESETCPVKRAVQKNSRKHCSIGVSAQHSEELELVAIPCCSTV